MPRTSAEQLSPIQQVILAFIGEYPSQYSRSSGAKLLVGSRSTRVIDSTDNPYYGRLADQGRKEITFEIDILLQQSYLALDHKNLLVPANSSSLPDDQ